MTRFFVPTAVMLYVLCGGSKCVHGVGFRVLEADRNSPVILNNSKREAKKVLNTENSLIRSLHITHKARNLIFIRNCDPRLIINSD